MITQEMRGMADRLGRDFVVLCLGRPTYFPTFATAKAFLDCQPAPTHSTLYWLDPAGVVWALVECQGWKPQIQWRYSSCNSEGLYDPVVEGEGTLDELKAVITSFLLPEWTTEKPVCLDLQINLVLG